MFEKKDAHRYKNAMLQKNITGGFAGTVTKPVFLYLQMSHHALDFPSFVTYEELNTLVLNFEFPGL